MFYGPELPALRDALLFFSFLFSLRLQEGELEVTKGPCRSSQSRSSTFILEPELKSPIYVVSRARQ